MTFDHSELLVIYDLTTFSMPGKDTDLVKEIIEKSTRILGVRRFALVGYRGGQEKVLGCWGFKQTEDIWPYLEGKGDNIFSYPLSGGEQGRLFWEQARPLTSRDRWLYQVLARRIEEIYQVRHLEERQKELERQKTREMELLLDGISVQVWYLKDHQTYGAANRAHADFFGLQKEDFNNRHIRQLFKNTRGIHQLIEENRQVFREKKQLFRERWLKNSRGEKRLLAITVTPTLDNRGEVEHAICTAQDITRRRLAEKDLRESEDLFRSLVESMDDTVFLMDRDMRYTGLYGNWAGRAGLNSGFFLDHTPQEIFGDKLGIVHEVAGARALGGENVVYEWSVRDNRGGQGARQVYYQTSLSPFWDSSGQARGLVGVSRDITERKQYENNLSAEKERLLVTLRSIRDGVVTTDNDGKVMLINPAAESLTGWSQGEAAHRELGEVLQLVKEEKTQELSQRPLDLIMEKSQGAGVSGHLVMLDRGGQRKIISGQASPIVDRQKTLGHVIVFRDITLQKKMESRLAFLQKLESIGQLAAGIAHEINTPMQYIGDNTRFLQEAFRDYDDLLGAYGLLLQALEEGRPAGPRLGQVRDKQLELELDFLREEISGAIEQSLEGIERVRTIILAMKDFSHPGQKEMVYADINKGIQGTMNISRNEWKYVADLHLELQEDLPPVYCQAEEINQVVLNMLINSVQAIKEKVDKGGLDRGLIKIATRQEGSNVKIMISDNGTGIPRKIINRVFEHFFTTKEVGQGTGQGLAIAHNIVVNRHGGTIEVESGPGAGATFTVSLPLKATGL